MKKFILLTGLTLSAIPPVYYFSAPRAEQVPHHGFMVNSEGGVRDCLGCHDGQIAQLVKLSTMIGRYFENHPVNRDYPPSNKADAFIPVEELELAGIKLINNQITCISCHNLKNQEKYHLAAPLERSNLCFKCHRI